MSFRFSVPVANAALICAVAVILLGAGGSVDAQEAPPAEQMLEQQAMLDMRLSALFNEMNDLESQLHRMRDVVTQMEQTLREGRLAGRSADELAKVEEERAAAEDRANALGAKLDEVRQRFAQTKAEASQWDERFKLAAQQRQRQEAVEYLERSNSGRQEAEELADAVIQQARQLAQGDNAAEAIRRALGESEIEKLRTEYAVIQQEAAQTKAMAEKGVVSAQELASLAARADVALAELRQAELRRLLEQVEREQNAFADRAAAKQTVEEAGHEDVLQTAFFRGYLETVQRYSALASDPETASVAAVVTAADLLRAQGPQASIEYFEPILIKLEQGADDPSTRAAQAAVRMQLAEAYHAAGRDPEALNMLRTLIVRGGTVAPRPQ